MKRFRKIGVALGAAALTATVAWGGVLNSAQASSVQGEDSVAKPARAAESASAGNAEVAVPPPDQLKVLQFNICGNADHCPDPTGVAAKLVESIEGRDPADRPDMISLNEVCRTQFDFLRARLGELGYGDGAFSNNHPPACDGAGFGNAVFTTDPIQDSRNIQLPNPVGAGEERGMLCVDTVFYFGCSTHLSTETENQLSQVVHVASVAEDELDAGKRVIVAGDLNMEPENSALNSLYEDCYGGNGQFGEGDASPYCTKTGENTAGNRKIDYIFFDTQNFGDFEGDVTGSNASDHNMLWATAQLR